MSFFKKNKERMVVTSIAIILIILIGVTSTERMSLTRFEKFIGNMFTPIASGVNSIGENLSNFFINIKEISTLREENEELKKKIAELEKDNRDYLNIIGKSDFLKNEYLLLKDSDYNLIPAQIIGKEPSNWFDRFTIDKGSKDGIKKGDTVIQGVEIDQNIIAEGMVGRVVDVGPNWAKIVTIVDEINNMAFKTIRTQDSGMVSGVSGNVDSKITGFLFDNKADVIKGDKLYTSGLGGAFVSDIYIGEVEDVINDDEDLMKRIKVKPAVNFKKLFKVYVISN